MRNIFKRTNKYGNYPKPSNMSKAECSRREKYNADIVYKEAYVPNKKLEEMLGVSVTEDGAQLKNKLTMEQLEECCLMLYNEMKLICLFRDLYMEDGHKYKDAVIANPAEFKDLRKCPTPNEIFSITYIRKVFGKAREQYIPETFKMLEDGLVEEAAVITLNKLIDNLRIVFAACLSMAEMNMIYTIDNFYGASVPLYDVY